MSKTISYPLPSDEPPHSAEANVDRLIREALACGATDAYCLPDERGVRLRYRVQGREQEAGYWAGELGQTCVTRIKVLAGLLTYRTRIAQDGVLRVEGDDAAREVRVSVMPTLHGERVALRFQGAGTNRPGLNELGVPAEVVDALRTLLELPAGLVILTGPTGSGKTTTIYAMIQELLRRGEDPAGIITLEDPIECRIDGISQTEVAHEKAWDYETALRAALRQDVKTIVVGEMRDRRIIHLTLDAALTGHRVITTFHAGDIPGVYARLLHHELEPFLIGAALTGVVCQRLVHRDDGRGVVPVIAVLRPDDAWRDFVISHPGLAALRERVRDYPLADLPIVAGRAGEAAGLTGSDLDRLMHAVAV